MDKVPFSAVMVAVILSLIVSVASGFFIATATEPRYVYNTLSLIVLTGGFGGFVHGIMLRKGDSDWRQYSLSYAFSDTTKPLGFIGDIFVGIAAGISIFFVAEALFGLNLNGHLDATNYFRVIAVGVVSGYMGPSLLDAISLIISTKLIRARATFEKEKDELTLLRGRIERHFKSDKLIFLGNAFRKKGLYQDALSLYGQATNADPASPDPLLQTALVYGEQAGTETTDLAKQRALYEAAISFTTKALEVDKNSWRANYNRACYKCLAHYDLTDVLADLSAAFALDPEGHLKRVARDLDDDLASIRSEEAFKKLVTGEVQTAQPEQPQQKMDEVPPGAKTA